MRFTAAPTGLRRDVIRMWMMIAMPARLLGDETRMCMGDVDE